MRAESRVIREFGAFKDWMGSNGEGFRAGAASLLLTAAIIGICFGVRRDVLGMTGWKAIAVGALPGRFNRRS